MSDHQSMTARKRRWLDDLRSMVDFLEAHPALIDGLGHHTFAYAHSPEEFADFVREIGEGEKSGKGGTLRVERAFGRHSVSVFTDTVCTRVQTGETEELVEVDTPPADAEIVETVTRHVVRQTVPVYEWKCPESVLGI
ncbi:MAG: hypothetical protein M0Z46_20005 [Actinomycetota bacterium]|jgi:hypothetical protein|nr:hypothetical protein [Actinomycetota bacterium]